MLLIRQQLRPDAVAGGDGAAAARARDHAILSGDRKAAVAPIAATLGIRNWSGGMKPAEKIAAIEALKAQGRRVLMVGDGLNDAPALAAAHVSLSPIDAAHIAQAQADAVFMGERLAPVLDAVVIARRARRLMQPEPVARGGLQRGRGADRHRRLRHAADRRVGDVGLVDPGDAQRAAGEPARGCGAARRLSPAPAPAAAVSAVAP